ncbi:RhuM family protein [Methanobrevibacter filiformis]|uniref:RhuM family protein n=1 Tax=Methanobrevibacter filiformis TaxID=55758 RepID=UPI001FE18AF9|nr:RhuM family protein [Methanobrevibacter filiformis]
MDKNNQTFWASQKTVAEIFGTSGQNISLHFINIFDDGELNEDEVSITSKELFKDQSEFIKYSLINPKKGGRPTKWYNLDGVIAVGYRVNSKKATQFRIWATSILREYIVKGFVLDKELLENGTRFGKDYFDELLEQIKEIRTSERRSYQKITDLYATSWDYNSQAELSKEFFAMVQNKLHYAVTEHTAPELIAERVNINKPYIGLQTWKNAPNGKITKKDVTTAKNVLTKEEISELQNITNMLLDYAENQARRHNPMNMQNWVKKVDNFLEFNEYPLLKDKGEIKKEDADKKAIAVYEKYKPLQDKMYKSDYDMFVEESKRIEKSVKKNDK